MMKHGQTTIGALLYSSYMLYRILFKNPYLYHMGMLPISVPKVKPVYIHIHASWVRVQTDMGKDRPKNTHGLPMSNTIYDCNMLMSLSVTVREQTKTNSVELPCCVTR